MKQYDDKGGAKSQMEDGGKGREEEQDEVEEREMKLERVGEQEGRREDPFVGSGGIDVVAESAGVVVVVRSVGSEWQQQ